MGHTILLLLLALEEFKRFLQFEKALKKILVKFRLLTKNVIIDQRWIKKKLFDRNITEKINYFGSV